jgi:Glycosyl hydrolase family 26
VISISVLPPGKRTTRLLGIAVLIWVVLAGCGGPAPIALGVTGDNVGVLDRFAGISGAPAAVYQWYQGWGGEPAFDVTRANAARSRGGLPLLTWEPWLAGQGTDQPHYALARLADGSHDAYIAAFARQVRDWGGQLGLRFLHEANAPFYPWGAGVNGNTPADAIAAWTHVRGIFDAEGADNVVWVWCVNVQAPGYADYASLYPGDPAVDWVAVDGYNGGDALPWGGWRSPDQVFGQSLDALHELTNKPLAITEVASAEQGGDKAQWISGLFDLAIRKDVRVLIWFEYDKETDWRIESSPGAAAAMRREATVPGRLGPAPLPDRVANR